MTGTVMVYHVTNRVARSGKHKCLLHTESAAGNPCQDIEELKWVSLEKRYILFHCVMANQSRRFG